MSATIHTFPQKRHDPGRFDALHQRNVDANELAAKLGTPMEWAFSAIDHLKVASCARTCGSLNVSAAAVHLALTYVEHLETLLGREPGPPTGAAA